MVCPVLSLFDCTDETFCSYFSGFANKDVAWFHAASKTLIVADSLFNIPATEQYSKSTHKATAN
ncbi:hypothetical protein C8R43DRAFT_985050 [Mycena crocata]|nr:hypothetical protein C8R43DRAFT_985050 [Mycena crocata]